jgi:hypothetical protein
MWMQIIPPTGGFIVYNAANTIQNLMLTDGGALGLNCMAATWLDIKHAGTLNAVTDYISLINTVGSNCTGNLAGGTGIIFNNCLGTDANGSPELAGRIALISESASAHNSYLSFQTALAGTVAEKMRLSSAGLLGLGVTPTAQIDSLAAGAAPYLHNRLVGLAHGMTSLAETNVFLKIAVADTTYGGAGISAYTGSDITALVISAVVGATTTTHPAFLLLGAKKAAAGPAWQALTATEVHSRWDNLTNPLMTLYGNGNLSNIGTLTIGSIADGTGNFLTNGGSGLVKSRTAAETLGDIGAMPSTTTSFNTNGAYNITKTTILADDAEAVFDTVLGLGGAMSHVNGYAMISLVGGAGWSGLFQVNDGTIAVSALSANAAANDTDGSICLFWDGSSRVIKNRSGGSHTFSVIFFGAITA